MRLENCDDGVFGCSSSFYIFDRVIVGCKRYDYSLEYEGIKLFYGKNGTYF